MRFKYDFEIDGNDKIPFIDIVLKDKEGGNTAGYRALLDSGAYANVFHNDIAETLKVDLDSIKDKEVFSGVEDTKRQMKGKPYVLELMVFQKGKNHKFDAAVIFTDEISPTGYPLLGRQFFFDQFQKIIFNYKSNKFYLETF